MSCIRSFNFISVVDTALVAPDIDTWLVGAQHFWRATIDGSSLFTIVGYKNINLYGIEAVGTVSTFSNTGDSVIVNDWEFLVKVNGYSPLVSGKVQAAPNNFNISQELASPQFSLSRYNPEMKFKDPIASALSIELFQVRASGIGAESLVSINLGWKMNFVVYYTYEGE